MPEPEIRQRPTTATGETPSPRGKDDKPEDREEDDPYNFDESDMSDDGLMSAPTFRDDRDLADDAEIPQFWGVVRVGDLALWGWMD